jgi:carbon storage regulator CsrA
MLVLARRLHERIIIPAVMTAVEVTAVKPGFVRLGVEAPPEITVLREEVYLRGAADAAGALPAGAGAEVRLARARHAWRDRLNNLALGLALLRQQAAAGAPAGLQATIAGMEAEVQVLSQQLRDLLEDETPGGELAAGAAPRVMNSAPANRR